MTPTYERVTVRIVRSGVEATAVGIGPLLGHKGEPWRAHLDDFLEHDRYGVQEGLRWQFYVASIGGASVGNVCIWSAYGVGMLGHVYTLPEARGRGIARRLMMVACADFDARGGRRLWLNTDADSFQERFYAGHGFVPVAAVRGAMRRGPEAPLEVAGRLRVIQFTWRRWPALNEFLLRADLEPQHWAAGATTVPCSAEWSLLRAWYGNAEGGCRIALLVDSAEAVHGLACRCGAGAPEFVTPRDLVRWQDDLEAALSLPTQANPV